MAFISDILDGVLPDVFAMLDTPGTITVSAATYDPLTQARADTSASYAANFAPLSLASQSDIDGTEVQHGDYKTMTDKGLIPANANLSGGLVTIAGKVYHVVKVDPIFGGPAISAYILYLRGV